MLTRGFHFRAHCTWSAFRAGNLRHANSTSTVCYTSTDSDVPTPEVFYAFTTDGARSVMLTACAVGAQPGLALLDDMGSAVASTSDACNSPIVTPVCAGQYTIRVDAADMTGEGFTLDVADVATDYPIAACCGDGLQDRGEACDDHNADDSDACLSTCVNASCGDGFIRTGVEACDDGTDNGQPGHCNAACDGFVEVPDAGQPSSSSSFASSSVPGPSSGSAGSSPGTSVTVSSSSEGLDPPRVQTPLCRHAEVQARSLCPEV